MTIAEYLKTMSNEQHTLVALDGRYSWVWTEETGVPEDFASYKVEEIISEMYNHCIIRINTWED